MSLVRTSFDMYCCLTKAGNTRMCFYKQYIVKHFKKKCISYLPLVNFSQNFVYLFFKNRLIGNSLRNIENKILSNLYCWNVRWKEYILKLKLFAVLKNCFFYYSQIGYQSFLNTSHNYNGNNCSGIEQNQFFPKTELCFPLNEFQSQ